MEGFYRVTTLSRLTGLSRQAIHKRAKAGAWKCYDKKNKRGGGSCRFYQIVSMDDEIKAMIAAAKIKKREPTGKKLHQAQVDGAMAKAELVRHYSAHLKKAPWGKKEKSRESFMIVYNAGIAFPKLFEALGPLSWKTIEQWKRSLSQGDALDLADGRGRWRRGKHGISAEAAQIIVNVIRSPNAKLTSEIIRISKAEMARRGVNDGLSDATYRRWINDWISVNYDEFIFWNEGERGLNNKCLPWLIRDWSRLEVGDMLVADGHTLNFEVINPFTGRPKRFTLITWYDCRSNFPVGWDLNISENTAVIASSLRWAILQLGKIPKAAYLDNGRAFGSRYFNGCDIEGEFSGLYERLGIKAIFAWPYHPQSKPVERFFGTFAELERLAPSYVGTSIANKPARMHGGEVIHKRLHERLTHGATPTIEEAYRAIAAWFDQYVQRPQKGHLNGAAPLEIFEAGRGQGVDRTELNFLMLSEEGRTIRRNGIQRGKNWYYHPELYHRKHKAKILYDLHNTDTILVYDQDSGDFICEAELLDKVHPAASILGDDVDRKNLSNQIELKKRLKKRTTASARQFLETEIIPHARRQLSQAGFNFSEDKPAKKTKVRKLSAAHRARIDDEVRQLEKLNAGLDGTDAESHLHSLGEMDRYEKLIELEATGQDIAREPHWQAFMSYYEKTEQYKQYREYFEGRRAQFAMMGAAAAQ